MSTSRSRRWLASLAGGVIAVRSGKAGPRSFERVAEETTAAVGAGRVVIIFPEDGAPSKPPQLRKLSPGLAHLSARSRSPVVPISFGGTHELYFRRRIVIRVLPAIDPPAETGRNAISEWMRAFDDLAGEAAVEVHEAAESKPSRWKVGRWLTGRYPRAE